jgi:hypothetical protein
MAARARGPEKVVRIISTIGKEIGPSVFLGLFVFLLGAA